MLLGNISLKQTHLVLRDVDGSEVGLTLDDSISVYQFIKDHLQEIEEHIQANWQQFLTEGIRPEQDT